MKLDAVSRVRGGMRALVLIAALLGVACGGKQTTGTGSGSGSDPPPPLKDTRTELEKRLAAACESVGKKATQCALDDAKKDLAEGKVSQKDFDLNTKPELLEENTARFVKKCNVPTMSSRQVRVLEVCFKEETECGPFLDCLSHLEDKPAK